MAKIKQYLKQIKDFELKKRVHEKLKEKSSLKFMN